MDCLPRGVFEIYRHFYAAKRQISLVFEFELHAGHTLVAVGVVETGFEIIQLQPLKVRFFSLFLFALCDGRAQLFSA